MCRQKRDAEGSIAQRRLICRENSHAERILICRENPHDQRRLVCRENSHAKKDSFAERIHMLRED